MCKGVFPSTSAMLGSAPLSSKNCAKFTQLGSERSIIFMIKSVLPRSSLPFTSTEGSSSRRFTIPTWLFNIAIVIGVTFQLFCALTSDPCWINKFIHSIKPEAAA